MLAQLSSVNVNTLLLRAGRGCYSRRQVKTEDIAKFQTEPTTAPATPASHQVWLEVKA